MEDKYKKYKDYKTILSVNALIWCGGKVLLLRRSVTKKIDPGVYSGIGGKVEPGESIYDATLREIEEEAGLTEFESIKVFSITQHPYPPMDCEWVNFYFNVTIKTQIKISKNAEGEFFWIDPKDVETLPMVNDLKEYIKILSINPGAYILGFFDNDKRGNPKGHTIHIL